MSAPALVPATPSTGSPISSMRWTTPMWATPRAPPPLRARARVGRPGSSTRGAKWKTMSGGITRTSKDAGSAAARKAARSGSRAACASLMPARGP